MDRYLIISPHTVKDCTKAIQEVTAMGYITHFDWGCEDGEHVGWAIIEADNSKEALLAVPSFQRNSAKAVRLKRFSPEDITATHRAS
jgi:hypothetical protein